MTFGESIVLAEVNPAKYRGGPCMRPKASRGTETIAG